MFKADGTIQVICPSCGAPVKVEVNVDYVRVSQYGDESGTLEVGTKATHASHACRKVVHP